MKYGNHTQGLLAIAIAAVLLMPLALFALLYPSLENILYRQIEWHGMQVAGHLASSLVLPGGELAASSGRDLAGQEVQLRHAFNLMKIRVVAADNSIVYSSAADEVGRTATDFGDGEKAATAFAILQDSRGVAPAMAAGADIARVSMALEGHDGLRLVTYTDVSDLVAAKDALLGKAAISLLALAVVFLTLAFFVARLANRRITRHLAVGEDLLAVSETRFQELFNNMTSGVIVFAARDAGRQFVVLGCNRTAEQLQGVRQEQAVGRPVEECFADFVQAGLPGVLDRVWRSGRQIRHSYTVAAGEGELFREASVYKLSSGELVALIDDVTARQQAEEGNRRTMKKLRRSLAGTIEALAMMVETRDPYTAGHQRRSTNLARAIAEEIGLESEMIDGIRMAGALHDIGKLSVPAEILSKPGKLGPLEFNLVKIHPQAGYEILKGIDFPWPVASIVLQHHERLDGSGYPAGLAGDDILIEARVLAVADVVEAMASHRPYRPASSLDDVLREIENHSGTLYDQQVVEACSRLLRERRFRLD